MGMPILSDIDCRLTGQIDYPKFVVHRLSRFTFSSKYIGFVANDADAIGRPLQRMGTSFVLRR
jgi:hypothetical protein